MGVWSRLFGRERRWDPVPQTARLSDPYLAEFFGSRTTSPGFTSPDAAVSALAVAARCVSLISDGLASLPLPVYRKLDSGGREEASGHAVHRVLNDAANPGMSAFELRVLLYGDLATHGNAFARIVLDGRGRVVELHYMPWRMVGVERLRSGRLRYRYSDPTLGTLVLLAEEVAHLRYRSRDGVLGLSPLLWAQDAIDLAMSQVDLARTQTRRGFVPDLAFESDSAVFSTGDQADAAFRRLKDQLTERVRRTGADGDPILLEAGYKAKQLAATGREAQFHEARVLGLEDVARVYGVPLSVVGLGKNASYGSLNEEARALVQNCFAPWARYGEAQLSQALLSAEGRRTHVIEHDLSALLRGDMLARLQSYEIGIRSGVWSPNECRVWEGQNKRDGGDAFLTPMNMQPSTALVT